MIFNTNFLHYQNLCYLLTLFSICLKKCLDRRTNVRQTATVHDQLGHIHRDQSKRRAEHSSKAGHRISLHRSHYFAGRPRKRARNREARDRRLQYSQSVHDTQAKEDLRELHRFVHYMLECLKCASLRGLAQFDDSQRVLHEVLGQGSEF